MAEGLIHDFAAAIHEEREPAVSSWEGARELRVVDAAYRSIETGEPMSVEY